MLKSMGLKTQHLSNLLSALKKRITLIKLICNTGLILGSSIRDAMRSVLKSNSMRMVKARCT